MILIRSLLLTFFLGAFTLFAAQPLPSVYERECAKLATSSRADAERLQDFFKLDWEHSLFESPEFATSVGHPGLNDRWSDSSLEAIARRQRELQAPRKVLQSIRRSKLTAADQLNYDLCLRGIQEAIEGLAFHGEYMPLTQMNGVQQDLAQTLEISPHANIKDYADILARLNAVPEVIDQTLVLLRKGLQAGITPPRITLRDVPDQVKNQMNPDPDKNPLLKSFTEFPGAIPGADRERLRGLAAVALKEKVLPAFAKLHEFLVLTYLPGARESIGMSQLPNGAAWYAYNARTQTTTKLTPRQIHEIGQSEVKRIRAEMDEVIRQTGFNGDFGQFTRFLHESPQFYYTNAADLLMGYRDISKRADRGLPGLFGKLPRNTYGVVAVPAYAEKSQTAAYYEPGSPDAGRAGDFFANTCDLASRPKWEMEVLTCHEAVPGHHLQISLAQEMEGVPEFRKHAGYTAFVEGWGLYAESLGSELGFYKDPYSHYGQLTFEMWRALRLVVDTGMHSLGWTRQQAINTLLANTSETEHAAVVEVDRYIVWPGQALAYKIGQLKIKELRDRAARVLGPKFDLRRFHDQILARGALPLDQLEFQTDLWLRSH